MPRPSNNLPIRRTRLAVALLSLAAIALELALMRMLALRFWSHFAYMVISVAILGFGASGTALTLLRRRVAAAKRSWMFALGLAFAVSVPLISIAARRLPLDVRFLTWDLSQIAYVAALEGLMFVPFFLAGAFVGIALMDEPGRIGGHYGANLLGSGAGAVAAVALMFVMSPPELLVASAAAVFVAAMVLLPRRIWAVAAAVSAAAALVLLGRPGLHRTTMSRYKMLPYVLSTPGAKIIDSRQGPLGRIDVVSGPAIHVAGGLSLTNPWPIPPHALLIVDGEQTSPVYHCTDRSQWAFTDQTTSAVAYHLRKRPSVCVLGAGGGADIGAALYHDATRIVALEMNGQIIDAMTGPLADRGGDVYLKPNVTVLEREAREYFAVAGETFDVVQFPAMDAFGASGAGLYSTQEAYLYTVEALAAMMDRLGADGVLTITRPARTPPRDGLKVFDTAAEMLRARGLKPSGRLAMIRSWATVTVLVSRRPFVADELNAIRRFCDDRGFDLCYLPGLNRDQANRNHILERPYYFEACRALVGPQRKAYLADYLFEIAATTDDRPYFFHFLRPRTLPILRQQLGRRSRAFVEIATIMLVAALLQALAMAAVFILLPLAPGVKALRRTPGKAAALGYFLMIGVGFMLLEMAFLQRLILYLGHPIYSAAVAIAGFLVFAGLGSMLSRRWRLGLRRLGAVAGAAVAMLGVGYLAGMDGWLALTHGAAMWVRFALAAGTIAPLALAMGHMLPTGMRLVSRATPALVPWCWAVNGLASVAATVAAPLLAMNVGFANVTIIAIICYAAAGALAGLLPKPREAPPAP